MILQPQTPRSGPRNHSATSHGNKHEQKKNIGWSKVPKNPPKINGKPSLSPNSGNSKSMGFHLIFGMCCAIVMVIVWK